MGQASFSSAVLPMTSQPTNPQPGEYPHHQCRRWAGTYDGGQIPIDEGGEGQKGENAILPFLRWDWSLRLELSRKRTRPLVEQGSLVGAFRIDTSTRSRTCLPVTLDWPGRSQKTSALLDSGAEESFIDGKTANRWGIPLVQRSRPLLANSLNGQNIGRIMKATILIQLQVSGNHKEKISLLIIGHPPLPPPFSDTRGWWSTTLRLTGLNTRSSAGALAAQRDASRKHTPRLLFLS